MPDAGPGGFVEAGYEPVRVVFSLLHGVDAPGGAFAAVADGRVVVDLWGGIADGRSRRPWHEQTLVPLFSATKGVVEKFSAGRKRLRARSRKPA